jgi:iron complex transport system substrate-binding protein
VGPDNYIEELLQAAGGINVLAKPGLPPYPRISLETVLREDPEMIIDLSGHSESEAERQAASVQVIHLWGEQSQLTAVRKGRIFVGVSNALLVPGPRAPEAAGMLFDFMHATTKGRAS